MTTAWTLERELRQLAGAHGTREALLALGLLPLNAKSFTLSEPLEGWQRGGAETYVYPFTVCFGDAPQSGEVRVILKACTPASPAVPIADVLDTWLSRREIVEHAGIRVPRLLKAGRGVILEAFIPESLREVLSDGPSGEARRELLSELTAVLVILLDTGFFPTSVSDLRSHGGDVVMVDFGEDLGDARQGGTGRSEWSEIAARLLATSGFGLTKEEELTILGVVAERAGGKMVTG